jgi:hypothetical protein
LGALPERARLLNNNSKAMQSRLQEELRAEEEGRICYCGHLGTHHSDWVWNWVDINTPVGQCAHADCDCLKYRHDFTAAQAMKAQWREDQKLRDAIRTAESKRAAADTTTWQDAVEISEHRAAREKRKKAKPLALPPPKVSRRGDGAVLDALEKLGGNPDDL